MECAGWNQWSEELAQARQEARARLEGVWAEVEQLQCQNTENDSRLEELAKRLFELRSKKSNVPIEKTLDTMPAAYDDDDADNEDETHKEHKPTSIIRRVVRRLSGKHSRPDFARASSDPELMPRSSPLPWADVNVEPDTQPRRRSFCGPFAVDTNSKNPFVFQALSGDPRAALLQEEREVELEVVNEEIQRKRTACGTLQRTIEVRQETLQQLQETLDQQDSSLHHETLLEIVKQREIEIEKIEHQLEVSLKSLTPFQEQHRTLRLEWFRIDDLLLCAEGESDAYLHEIQAKIKRCHDELNQKEAIRKRLEETQSETLSSMRQDVMEHLDASPTHDAMNRLQTSFGVLREKELALTCLLLKRQRDRGRLATSLEQIAASKQKATDKLNDLILLQETLRFNPSNQESISSDYLNRAMAHLRAVENTLVQYRRKTSNPLAFSGQETDKEGIECEYEQLLQALDLLHTESQSMLKEGERQFGNTAAESTVSTALERNEIGREDRGQGFQCTTSKALILPTSADGREYRKKLDELQKAVASVECGLRKKEQMVNQVSKILKVHKELEAKLLRQLKDVDG